MLLVTPCCFAHKDYIIITRDKIEHYSSDEPTASARDVVKTCVMLMVFILLWSALIITRGEYDYGT
ncbi:MAG: hypothetical protein ACRCX2_04940 [Paraclostridium sp.]